ncbi:amino acid adenylation domain-containing protein [Catenulispora sp. NL8]|uniref:Amino acid adenylation domain-containing protein n=1 Tax=Catenulispora pinistramenti TaxID=2705254 RepID=A0ABS5KM86_9ACTN|nr:non-ribosomal peptide synthetase [Catenulispora pinistramenti]MBS2547168.1 amino acid adenylation domain-containing protein [Catenulispora pinistramenti]
MTTPPADQAVVGVLAVPGRGALSGMLGALAAGAAFLPLDPKLPDSRLDFMVADAGVRTVLADRAGLARARGIAQRAADGVRVIAIPDGAGDDSRGADDPIADFDGPRLADADDLAYVIYTSGSTGAPKGVAVTHGNLVPLMAWSTAHFGLGPGTSVVQNLNPAFDFGVWEMLTTVCTGGTLYFPGPLGEVTPGAFARALAEWGIDTLHTTPGFFAELVAAGHRLDTLRQVHLGGEKVTGALVTQAAAVLTPDCLIHNGYGPTETAVNCAIHVVDRARIAEGDPVPIGVASAENVLYVLSQEYEPVPDGETGELYVGGPAVARGYGGLRGLTAERFLPDPYSGRPGARMYRTGDLVRRLPDGAIDYLGRVDHQVKVRGHRLELGEIEAVLTACPGISAATVVAVPVAGRSGATRLVGHVVPAVATAGQSMPSALDEELLARVRAFATERLPSYMVPAAFVGHERLPLTPNGKVDRAALTAVPAPAPAPAPVVDIAGADPGSVLAAIWAEILAVPVVRPDDNFFDLGGDSLSALRVVEAAQAAGLNVDPVDILAGQSIEAVLEMIA